MWEIALNFVAFLENLNLAYIINTVVIQSPVDYGTRGYGVFKG